MARVSKIDEPRIVALRLQGLTQRQIADQLGCSVEAVRARLGRPDTVARIAAEREQALAETTDLLAALSRAAAIRLADIMRTGSDPAAVAACRVILVAALSHREVAILEPRLTALEQQAAGADVLRWRP